MTVKSGDMSVSRKTQKKILSIGLVVLLFTSSIAILCDPLDSGATTISSGSCGPSLTWTLDDQYVLTISGSGTMDYYDYYGTPWASYKNSIRSIIIESGATSIGGYAFYNCDSLISIVIPDSVDIIGGYAFSNCRSLKSVTIPNGVKSIGGYAFEYCSSMTSITISNSVTSIGQYAFNNCSSLKSVTIPNSVKDIGRSAFSNCTNLESVTLPDVMTNMGAYIFSGCSSLKSIKIPGGISAVPNYAFSDCRSLTTIEIPSTLTDFNKSAFNGCTSITSITVDSENMKYSSSDGILYDKGKTKLILCPVNKKTITLPSSLELIETRAFDNCNDLSSVTFSANSSLLVISTNAFYQCYPKAVTIEKGTHIEFMNNAFYYNPVYSGTPQIINVTAPDGFIIPHGCYTSNLKPVYTSPSNNPINIVDSDSSNSFSGGLTAGLVVLGVIGGIAVAGISFMLGRKYKP